MSKCSNCGAELDAGAKFCMECGTPVPQVKKCVQCGMELPLKAKFCFGCGAPQEGGPTGAGINMGDKNVIAGDVIGQKVVGDNVQSKIMGNVINNSIQDETKKVVFCHICGWHLTNDSAHTCPKCGNIVCEEHFDRSHNCCRDCLKKVSNKLVVDVNGKGDFVSISEAVKYATNGTTITVRPGVYREHFVVDKNIVLYGESDDNGAPVIWDDSSLHNSVVTITAEAEIINMKIWGNRQPFPEKEKALILNATHPDNCTADEFWSKSIYIKSSCKLKGVDIGYSAGYGIAVSKGNFEIALKKCKLHDNIWAGLSADAGSIFTIEMCEFNSNNAGLFLKKSEASILNSQIFKNDFGVFSSDCKIGAISCDFFNNQVAAARAVDGTNLSLKKCLFGANAAIAEQYDDWSKSIPRELHNVAAIYANTASLQIEDCHLFDGSYLEDDVIVKVESSTFGIGCIDDLNCGIFCNGRSIKADIKACRFTSICYDKPVETEMSGHGIGVISEDQEYTPDIKITKSRFDNLESGIKCDGGNYNICDSSFEYLQEAIEFSENPSIVVVDSCTISKARWAEHGDISKIQFINMESPKKDTIVVASDGSGDFTSFKDALDCADDGATLQVKLGTYQGSFVVNKQVNIIGEEQDGKRPAIQWKFEESDVGIEISAKATLKNLNVACISKVNHESIDFHNGKRHIAAIHITDDASIENICVENSVDDGIIVAGENVNPTIVHCEMKNNQGTGIVLNSAGGNISRCEIYGNAQSGVLAKGNSDGVVSECIVHDNRGDGFLIIEHAHVNCSDCEIYGNDLTGVGFVDNTSGILKNCHIHDNKREGVFVGKKSAPRIESCSIYDNNTKGEVHAGILVWGEACPKIMDCTIFKHLGAGIYETEHAKGVYSNCVIYANGEPGIVCEGASSGTFKNCHIYKNECFGVILSGECTPTIEGCRIHDNKRKDKYFPGIDVQGKANPCVNNCEVFGHLNFGILVSEQGKGTFSNCDIHDNDDVGVSFQDSAKGSFIDCRIHNNTCGGIQINNQAYPEIKNCKVYENFTKGNKCSGIVLEDCSKVIVSGCEIYGHTGYGIYERQRAVGEYANCKVHDNAEGSFVIKNGSVK